MKKGSFVLLLLLVPALVIFSQETSDPATQGIGRTASLGVEASTTFAWDIDNGSTGLFTRVGMELIFDLFPAADRGIIPADDSNAPAVRLLLKDAAFTWWNTYQTSGGNYEQDHFNNWQARPLILTFETFLADLVWQNYFFRVASSTTTMQVNSVSLRSIFDDVMDANERFYYRRSQALWRTDRYNIQNLPILGTRIDRDILDTDLNSNISGILAGGAEFDFFSITLKAASNQNGRDNSNNAWLFGLDFELVPFEGLKFDLTALAGLNYEKTSVSENPIAFGLLAQYQLPLSDDFILTPYAGFDFFYGTQSQDVEWELGAGVFLYTRGYDERTSYRVLDFDNVIPVGASFAMNMDQDTNINLMLSWFDPPGRDSLIENFGGFLQLELSDLLGNDKMYFGVLTQLEYVIAESITPYVRAGYRSKIGTGDYILSSSLGVYYTPAHFFSIDLRYSMNFELTPTETKQDLSLLSAVFTIRM